jgi:hypothetical protein
MESELSLFKKQNKINKKFLVRLRTNQDRHRTIIVSVLFLGLVLRRTAYAVGVRT